jgi:N-acetyl-anhydromuramoyl-L-alanine amidase
MFKLIEFLLFFFIAYWIFSFSKRKLVKRDEKPTAQAPIDVQKMVSCQFCQVRLPIQESYVFEGRYYCDLAHFHQIDKQGWLGWARHVPSPNADARPEGVQIDTVVIHHISLPEGQFGGSYIEDFFTNRLNPDDHSYFSQIAHLEVSAHFFIKRDGELVQFVSTRERAWHAGQSRLFERERINDFSLGIELEGTGEIPFEEKQYQTLAKLIHAIEQAYDTQFFVGHSDISPGRKTDPGKSFDWEYVSKIAKIPEKKLPFGMASR